MYVNGSGFRAIERVKKVQTLADSLTLLYETLRVACFPVGVRYHTTVINWVKEAANILPEQSETEEIPEVTEIDELETFVGSKKIKFGCVQQGKFYQLESLQPTNRKKLSTTV